MKGSDEESFYLLYTILIKYKKRTVYPQPWFKNINKNYRVNSTTAHRAGTKPLEQLLQSYPRKSQGPYCILPSKSSPVGALRKGVQKRRNRRELTSYELKLRSKSNRGKERNLSTGLGSKNARSHYFFYLLKDRLWVREREREMAEQGWRRFWFIQGKNRGERRGDERSPQLYPQLYK